MRERERNAFVEIIISYFEVLDTSSDCLLNWLRSEVSDSIYQVRSRKSPGTDYMTGRKVMPEYIE